MKPKYFQTDRSVKTIDIQTMEWFDKTYGNSYFSALVTINAFTEKAFSIRLPFQYGYGSHSVDMAFKALKEAGVVSGRSIHQNVTRYSKTENCLQRDVKAFGKAA